MLVFFPDQVTNESSFSFNTAGSKYVSLSLVITFCGSVGGGGLLLSAITFGVTYCLCRRGPSERRGPDETRKTPMVRAATAAGERGAASAYTKR